MRHHKCGFTIIELMIVLAVTGVILAIGVPSFNSTIKNSRLTGSVNDVVSAMHLSRSEASKRRTPVVLCTSNTPLSSDAASCTNSEWNEGWLIYADNNGNGSFDANGDAVIQRTGPQHEKLNVISDDAVNRSITYLPNGFAQLPLDTSSDRFIVYCDNTADDQFSRVVAISNSGRPRVVSREGSATNAPSCVAGDQT